MSQMARTIRAIHQRTCTAKPRPPRISASRSTRSTAPIACHLPRRCLWCSPIRGVQSPRVARRYRRAMNSDISRVRTRREDHVAVVELDRPDALNALSTALASELTEVMARIGADSTVRAVVLVGNGDRAFCVGADLKERNAMDDDAFRVQRQVFRAAFGSVRNLPHPSVAGVHGFALGGGLELALSCDIVVADDSAVVGLPETTIGL